MRLLTFAPSHFSEKARWALDRAGLVYQEERHTPLLHRLVLRRVGGGKSVPVLVLPGRVLKDSPEILHFADEHLPPDRKLYPDEPELRKLVEDYEQRVGKEVGLSVPRWAYFYLLSRRDLMLRLFLPEVGPVQARLFRWLFPAIGWLMRKGLGINAEATRRMEARISAHLDQAAALLDGDRQYLFGDRFTAADLSLAALTAPLISVPGYGGTLAPFEEMPAEARPVLEKWRRHPVAAYAERIYRQHRRS
ncbi:glutathione S-transferase family protein [bacterium]|nr:glutathione S-transferase family protein [bacterium]